MILSRELMVSSLIRYAVPEWLLEYIKDGKKPGPSEGKITNVKCMYF